MIDQQDNATPSVDSTLPPRHVWARHSRLVIISGLAVFGVSLLFPIVASLIPSETFPVWIGWLDVTLACGVIVLMLVIDTIARGHIDERVKQISYRVYRVLANLPIVFLIVFFAFGTQIKWDVLLLGLAWRLWVFGYALPAGLAVWSMAAVQHQKI